MTQEITVDPTFEGMARSLGRIEGKMDGVCIEVRDLKNNDTKLEKKIDKNTDAIKKNSEKIQKVETEILVHETEVKTEEKVKKRFSEEHPIITKAGMIGGGTAGGGVLGFLLYLLLDLIDAGVIP